MGCDVSKLGDFGLLPLDLRKPGFIRRYLSGSDFKLLLAAYKVNMIGYEDVMYYFDHYPTSNLELYKYYDFTDCVENIDYNSENKWVKFIHKNGAVFDADVSIYLMGNLDMVQYLHENNCPIHPIALYESIDNHDMEIILYLHEKGYRYTRSSFSFMLKFRRNIAASGYFSDLLYQHDEVAKFLFENVALSNYEGVFTMAVIYCDYFIIKYMIESGLVELDAAYHYIFCENYTGAGRFHMNYLQTNYGITYESFGELL